VSSRPERNDESFCHWNAPLVFTWLCRPANNSATGESRSECDKSHEHDEIQRPSESAPVFGLSAFRSNGALTVGRIAAPEVCTCATHYFPNAQCDFRRSIRCFCSKEYSMPSTSPLQSSGTGKHERILLSSRPLSVIATRWRVPLSSARWRESRLMCLGSWYDFPKLSGDEQRQNLRTSLGWAVSDLALQ